MWYTSLNGICRNVYNITKDHQYFLIIKLHTYKKMYKIKLIISNLCKFSNIFILFSNTKI